MNTYKNVNFTKDSECTNIVFCTANEAPAENWAECKNSEIVEANCTQLYIQAGVRYYGYM